ncbi:Uma2 family endonuclease [Planktothrix paucivesiculata]|nr:Uma2 family endonuclease [Planktothrix paucivesiculata]
MENAKAGGGGFNIGSSDISNGSIWSFGVPCLKTELIQPNTESKLLTTEANIMALTPQEIADLMPDTSQLESDEPGMESDLYYLQLALLVSSLDWLWREREDYFIGANLTLYYSQKQLINRELTGPDFFVVKNTVKTPRPSWVVWQEEGQYPDIIIELTSDATAKIDREDKKNLYQNRFRTPEYFWFSPETLELAGFRLNSENYDPISSNESGLFWSQVLGLYLGIHNQQLRYFSPDGELIATPTETALQAFSLVNSEQQQTDGLAE